MSQHGIDTASIAMNFPLSLIGTVTVVMYCIAQAH